GRARCQGQPSGDCCGLVGPVGPFGGWWVSPGRCASGPRGQPACQPANFLGGLAGCPHGAGSVIFPGFEGARGGAACQPAGGLRYSGALAGNAGRKTIYVPRRAVSCQAQCKRQRGRQIRTSVTTGTSCLPNRRV